MYVGIHTLTHTYTHTHTHTQTHTHTTSHVPHVWSCDLNTLLHDCSSENKF